MQIVRLFNTIRYLRPVQVYGRVWFRLARPRLDLRAPPAPRAPPERWVRPARRDPSLLGPDRFLFLNQDRDLASHGWDDPAVEKLWRYNQHYFDDLNAAGAGERSQWHRALLLRWVQENTPALGTGWEPYPTSLRIVNWIKWSLAGNKLPDDCLHSLAVQVRWLTRRMETHLLGNHLFSNAKALVFAGSFFRGPEAEKWLDEGLRLLAREVPEQILPDGGHFERSTMYHALALEDLLDLCNITDAFPRSVPTQGQAADWRSRVALMCDWLSVMSHPDGGISLFNDAAIGIAPPSQELFRYAKDLGMAHTAAAPEGLTRLSASGYLRMAQGPLVAIVDVAPVGPDYLPGHAHADTLSFELSAFNQRVLVNSGTSCYGRGDERLRQRGTAAHNTVVVDGQDSSEVWGGFRVARRARPVGLQVSRGAGIRVSCSHDGYRRLRGSPAHVREWRLDENSLEIADRVTGCFTKAEARFHLHPTVTVEARDGDTTGRLETGNGHRLTWHVDSGVQALTDSSYHPRFGVCEPSRCLVIRLQGGSSRIRFNWS